MANLLMDLGLGLMQAGAPSRRPSSLLGALGQGAASGLQQNRARQQQALQSRLLKGKLGQMEAAQEAARRKQAAIQQMQRSVTQAVQPVPVPPGQQGPPGPAPGMQGLLQSPQFMGNLLQAYPQAAAGLLTRKPTARYEVKDGRVFDKYAGTFKDGQAPGLRYMPGKGYKPQSQNVLDRLAPKVEDGTASPADVRQYESAAKAIYGARDVTDPVSGQTQRITPSPMPESYPRTPGMVAGRPGVKQPGIKPRAPLAAAYISNMRSGLRELGRARKLIFSDLTPKGQLTGKSGLKTKEGLAGVMGIPRTKGRDAKKAMRRAVEIVLRARTGAAAPKEEVDNYMDFYYPSLLDTDEGARAKMVELQAFFDSSLGLLKASGGEPVGLPPGPGQSAAAPTEAAPSPAIAPPVQGAVTPPPTQGAPPQGGTIVGYHPDGRAVLRRRDGTYYTP